MNKFSVSTKLPLPTESEIIYLEPEHFERAVEISNQIMDENHRWKAYLSVLALCSFEEWLSEQVSNVLISADYSSILQNQCTTESIALSYLKLGEFNVCLIISESVTDDIFLPRNAIESPLIAHFYVLVQILEEQEEAIIQGCLRYDKLISHQSLTLIDNNYQLLLYSFNTEINNLLLAPRLLSPTAIIPKIENTKITNLNNWLQNTFETSWLAIEDLLDTALLRRAIIWQQAYRSDEENQEQINSLNENEIQELLNQITNNSNEFQRQKAVKRLRVIARGNNQAILTLINLLETTQDDETLWTIAESLWQIAPGVTSAGVRRVKLIDLGMQVAGRTVALAVAIIQKSNQQFGVLLRVYPTHDEPYLPVKLKLLLLDNFARILHEAIARKTDNYIQIKLSGNKGEAFSVKIALDEGSITEHFEI